MSNTITTFGLIEDDISYREFLRDLIEKQPGWSVVFACPDMGSAFTRLQSQQPDLILLDINLPDISGLEAIPRIKSSAPKVTVMMLTVENQPERIFECLTLGADGYHIKGTSAEQTLGAISDMIHRHASLDAGVARQIISALRSFEARGASEILTIRQREILQLVARGKQRGEIARLLGISTNTVKRHLSNIFQRLGAHSQIEAVNIFSQLQSNG